MDIFEDPELLRGEQLERIYRAHSGWLKAKLRFVGGTVPPEDLVQEAFLQISRYPASIPLRYPRALLLEIARNVARSSARRFRRAASLTNNPIPSGITDADQFEALVLKQTVIALPEIYRDVFMLSRFGGMSYQEIAEARGLSVKTVEWRMSKALAICAARLRE